jgi:group I intron endonuclease
MKMKQLPKDYVDFIEECKHKNYSDKQILHKHHILPKFMNGDDSSDNLIILSTEDHYNAHMILARQYKKIDKRFIGNILSANLIKRHFGGKTPEELSTAVSGKNNGMYGKTHSEEYKMYLKEKMSGESNPFYGKNHTDATKKKMSENHVDFSGGKNPASKKCVDKMTGKIYGSIKEMALDLGRRRCTIGKYLKDEKNERFCYV